MVQYLMAYMNARRDEEGQGLVEYALIIALVAVASIGARAPDRHFTSGLASDWLRATSIQKQLQGGYRLRYADSNHHIPQRGRAA
ncbi:MAG: hypothetical protein R2849_02185 [Thermomicrobiales bacterium]